MLRRDRTAPGVLSLTRCSMPALQVWMMLSITYYSFLKPSFITKGATKKIDVA